MSHLRKRIFPPIPHEKINFIGGNETQESLLKRGFGRMVDMLGFALIAKGVAP